MKKSNLNYIAEGINKPDKGKSFLRIIQIVTMVAIALGCVSVLIPLAVLDGFHNELRTKATVFSSHISIKDFNEAPIINATKIESVINQSEQIDIYDPIIKKNALLKTKEMAEGIVVKGIAPYRTKKLFDEFVIEGKYEFSTIKANEIIISQDIAKKNNLKIGSKVFLYNLSKDDIVNNKLPNIEAFKIKAIFNTGFA